MVGLDCTGMDEAQRQTLVMRKAKSPFPVIYVHLNLFREISALLKVMVVRKEPFPT